MSDFAEMERKVASKEPIGFDVYTLLSDEFQIKRDRIKSALLGYMYGPGPDDGDILHGCRKFLMRLGLKSNLWFDEFITHKQLEMMKHTWGFDSREPGYRNRYCTQTGDSDAIALVQLGYFQGPSYVGEVGEGCGLFFLTNKGIAFMEELLAQHKGRARKRANRVSAKDQNRTQKRN